MSDKRLKTPIRDLPPDVQGLIRDLRGKVDKPNLTPIDTLPADVQRYIKELRREAKYWREIAEGKSR